MKVYKTIEGIVIENENVFYLSKQTDWDQFINDDNLYAKIKAIIHSLPQTDKSTIDNLLAPVGTQELWACGVTYYRSMVGRQEESKEAGGGDFYARVYNAERPEVFFKSPAYRIVHPNGFVRIRKDSTWDVPEPELTLVVTSSAKIVGYTIGNDMSSRSIEGENPLYLPQAKTYDGAAAVGPCIYVTENPLNASAKITMQIYRKEALVFEVK